jgi:predicted phosphodiesterase
VTSLELGSLGRELLELGQLRGTLLFFGGPYSNLQATQALKSVADHLAIPASNVICTGDTVAYCAQPNETVELLQDWGGTVVMGNCEESLGFGAGDCGCGFEPGSACNALAEKWYRYADRHILTPHRQWMRGLPRMVKFKFLRKQFAVIHGGVKKINQFTFCSTSTEDKWREIQAAGVDGIIGGHCGLPFTQQFRDKVWHNPGVIGLPANDGTSRVWYSLWSEVEGKIKIEHRSMNYDAGLTRTKMLNAGLDEGYADTLRTGLWPSVDVLPQVEKTRQARALSEEVYCV